MAQTGEIAEMRRDTGCTRTQADTGGHRLTHMERVGRERKGVVEHTIHHQALWAMHGNGVSMSMSCRVIVTKTSFKVRGGWEQSELVTRKAGHCTHVCCIQYVGSVHFPGYKVSR